MTSYSKTYWSKISLYKLVEPSETVSETSYMANFPLEHTRPRNRLAILKWLQGKSYRFDEIVGPHSVNVSLVFVD